MMSVCKTMKISKLIVLILVVQGVSQVPELSSTLHSTIYGVPVAYVGETVEFTCVVRESNSMAWSSDEYIGTGGEQLGFLAAESIGSTLTAPGNRQTIATLVNTTGSDFIVSRLQITIISDYQTPSVQCRNINADTTATITFLLADVISTTCDRQFVCPGETVTCICVTWNSNALNWTTINGNSLAFSSTEPLQTRRNVTGSSTFAVLTENSNRNGIRIIMSNLTFIASMMNVLVCENVGQSTRKSVIIPVSDTCIDPTIQVTTSIRNNVVVSCAGPIAAAVVLPIISTVAALLIVILLVIVFCRKKKGLEKTQTQQEEKERALNKREKKVGEKETALDTKEKEVGEKEKTLNEKEKEMGEKETALDTKEKEMGEKESALNKKEKEMGEKERALNEKEKEITNLEGKKERKLRQEKKELKEAKEKAEKDLKVAQQKVQSLEKEVELLKSPPQDTGSQVPLNRRKKLSTAGDHEQTATSSSPQGDSKLLGSELPKQPGNQRPKSPTRTKKRGSGEPIFLTDMTFGISTSEKEPLLSPQEQLGPELPKSPTSRAKSPTRTKKRGSGN